jgi:VanZ family protein
MPDMKRGGSGIRPFPVAIALALMFALYLVATLPAQTPPPSLPPAATGWISWSLLNNILHVPAYLLLAWVLYFCVNGKASPTAAVLIAVMIATAYGGLMELMQISVPGRYASLGDMVLNALGATAGAMLAARRALRTA